MKVKALLEGMDPLFPSDFFLHMEEIYSSKEKKHSLLSSVSVLLGEEEFARVSLGWDKECLSGCIEVDKVFESSCFPRYAEGDAIEIFLDTRDNKKGASLSKFCHHFLFLPEEVNGVKAQEITRFCLEESHPLCDPTLLLQEVLLKKKGYVLFFTLPKEVLYGYDPEQFSRIGFAYCIHRSKGKAQHYPFSSKYFDLLQHPNLWASLTLK